MSPQVAKRSVNSGGTILIALSGNSQHLVINLAGFDQTRPQLNQLNVKRENYNFMEQRDIKY